MEIVKNFIYLNVLCRIEIRTHSSEKLFLISLIIPQFNSETLSECEVDELFEKITEATDLAKEMIEEKVNTFHLSNSVVALMKDGFEVKF